MKNVKTTADVSMQSNVKGVQPVLIEEAGELIELQCEHCGHIHTVCVMRIINHRRIKTAFHCDECCHLTGIIRAPS